LSNDEAIESYVGAGEGIVGFAVTGAGKDKDQYQIKYTRTQALSLACNILATLTSLTG
jgi:hypothetical protein